MSDPRMILKEKLCLIGISSKDSTIIALDAGSFQVDVNREYLENYDYSEDIVKKTLKLVSKFYTIEVF